MALLSMIKSEDELSKAKTDQHGSEGQQATAPQEQPPKIDIRQRIRILLTGTIPDQLKLKLTDPRTSERNYSLWERLKFLFNGIAPDVHPLLSQSHPELVRRFLALEAELQVSIRKVSFNDNRSERIARALLTTAVSVATLIPTYLIVQYCIKDGSSVEKIKPLLTFAGGSLLATFGIVLGYYFSKGKN
ncbi:MAG: hypothetical protein QE269_10550 [Fimbriimonas sp.]|nr:hypothetical protein [Fimbriimonas sp.]